MTGINNNNIDTCGHCIVFLSHWIMVAITVFTQRIIIIIATHRIMHFRILIFIYI